MAVENQEYKTPTLFVPDTDQVMRVWSAFTHPGSFRWLLIDVNFGNEHLAYTCQMLARICRTGLRPDRGVLTL